MENEPKYCGKCEEGWIYYSTFKDGDECYICQNTGLKTCRTHWHVIPCPCNQKGMEEMREYREYLNKQSWYNQANHREDRKRNIESMVAQAEATFGTRVEQEKERILA